ncbi:MAG TPA: hypothetical protein VK162_09110 [Streptosporangiaceae bacterium]|nr:hypothetical protein [Streptosporangiaceae bacterium]
MRPPWSNGMACGGVGDGDGGDRGGGHVIEGGELVGEHDGLRHVDPPGGQRRSDGGQPADPGGQGQQPVPRARQVKVSATATSSAT